jgi:AsmA family/AsmA-like C-terminal region
MSQAIPASMSKSAKVILIAVGTLAGAMILFTVIAALVLRVSLKSRVEAIASEALGMEVQVGGRLAIGFLPGLHVALADVHFLERGVEIASAGEVDLGVELMPMLRKEFRIDQIELKRLTVVIQRDHDGRLSVDAWSEANGTHLTLAVAKVSVSDATLEYADKQSGKGFEAAGCDLDVSRLGLSPGESSNLLQKLSLTAKLACRQIRTKDSTASDLRLSVDGQNGIFHFLVVSMQLFGGRGSGNATADFTGSVPIYHVRYRLAQFRLEEFFKNLSPKSIGEGSMDFSATLSLRGRIMTTAALMPTVGGVASLRGDNLKLAIGNLDEKLARYDSSQSFNLVDVAAFFFAGPLGLVITRGYDFARILQGAEGTTTIRTLVSEWQVEHGVAQARDVAMATGENRIALKGDLDFVSGRYDEVTVADIDAKGCAKVLQKVHGPFMNPVVEKPNMLGTITGPTRKLFRQAKSLFGGKCDVFYAGSVAPPK